MNGKCPKCDTLILGVNISAVDGYVAGVSQWRCLTYSCRACQAVLSVQMDPIAIRSDIMAAIKAR